MEIRRPKIKQRTGAEVRRYVKERAQMDNMRMSAPPGTMFPGNRSDGTQISGADLVRSQVALELLPDLTLQKKISALFHTYTKYQALQMILEGNLLRDHPAIAEQIADKATELDYIASANQPPGRGSA
jgi:hypothetical protein